MAFCLAAVCLAAAAKVAVVAERESHLPVEGATVFSRSGTIIGQTDAAGRIEAPAWEFPLSARCMGYIGADAQQDDTLFLTTRDFALDSVVVSPDERPVTRIVGFAREYATGATTTDTVTQVSEYMAELYLAPEKTKGYKKDDSRIRVRNSRAFMRRIFADGTDTVAAGEDSFLSVFRNFFFIPSAIELTDGMKQGARTGQVAGKYAPKMILSTDDKRMRAVMRPLSDYKEQKMSPWIFKLLSLSMDMTLFDLRYDYQKHQGSADYLPAELLEGAFDARIIGTGRWIKKMFDTKDAVTMDMHVEFYPVDITHLSIEEYKEMRRDETPLPWTDSPNIAPLPAPYDSILRRAANPPSPKSDNAVANHK